MAYRMCTECGAALDPGERCDCREQPKSQSPVKKRRKKTAPARPERKKKKGDTV